MYTFLSISSSLSYAHPYQYTYTHQRPTPPHPLTGFIALYPLKSQSLWLLTFIRHCTSQYRISYIHIYSHSHSVHISDHRTRPRSPPSLPAPSLSSLPQWRWSLSLLPWPYSSMCLLFAYSESYACQSRTFLRFSMIVSNTKYHLCGFVRNINTQINPSRFSNRPIFMPNHLISFKYIFINSNHTRHKYIFALLNAFAITISPSSQFALISVLLPVSVSVPFPLCINSTQICYKRFSLCDQIWSI